MICCQATYRGIKSYQADWGSLEIKGGASNPRRYDSDYPDHQKLPNGKDRYPRNSIKFENVKIGENLKDDWEKIKDAMDAIGEEKRP